MSNKQIHSDQKLNEYEETAKKFRVSDLRKRRITSKFSDKSTQEVWLNGAQKLKRDTLNVALDKLIIDLNKRGRLYG